MSDRPRKQSRDHARRGLVHLYTGDGKGKTTAALGLALRASGQGMRVCVLQFLKGSRRCGEHRFLDRWPAFEIVQPSPASFFSQSQQERQALAREALAMASAMIQSGRYDLVVLDEVVTAIKNGLITEAEVLGLVASRPESLELALTGRGATPALVAQADLVTEMLAVKHPLARGIRARRGIEY